MNSSTGTNGYGRTSAASQSDVAQAPPEQRMKYQCSKAATGVQHAAEVLKHSLLSKTLTSQIMGFEQYHEPATELSKETRTFARMIMGVIEEAEAINWYEQRIAVETNREARAIMENAQQEEMKHF